MQVLGKINTTVLICLNYIKKYATIFKYKRGTHFSFISKMHQVCFRIVYLESPLFIPFMHIIYYKLKVFFMLPQDNNTVCAQQNAYIISWFTTGAPRCISLIFVARSFTKITNKVGDNTSRCLTPEVYINYGVSSELQNAFIARYNLPFTL